MRIYAAADLHGRQECLATLREGIRQSRAEALVLAGDILNYGRGRELLPALDRLSVPVFMVRGNSDPFYLERWAAASRNVRDLHLSGVSFLGCDFIGAGGTLPIPFHSLVGWREHRTLDRLAAMVHPHSVLVAHPPPRGCCDRVLGRFSAGSRGLAHLIQKTAPAVMICGHIHEAAGVSHLGATLVVNCALGPQRRGALIVVENGHRPTAELL